MVVSVKHSTIATYPDEAGAEINKAEWNDDHVIDTTGATDGDILTVVAGEAEWSPLDLSGLVPYTGATGPVDLNGQDLSNVSAFTATSSVLAPNFYIGYGSPTGHLFDLSDGGFGLAYYGNDPFVGFSGAGGQPYFGADPEINSTGMYFDGTAFEIAAQGGQPVALTVNAGVVVQGDSANALYPILNVFDTGTSYSGSTTIAKIVAGYGDEDRPALEVLDDGACYLGNYGLGVFAGGSGYLSSSYNICWDTVGRLSLSDNSLQFATYAKLEVLSGAYTQLLLGWDLSNYYTFNVSNSNRMTVRPNVNSTNSWQFQNAGGTAIVNIDSTNQRVGIGGVTVPLYQLHTSGDVLFGSSNATPIIRLGGNTSAYVALKRSSTTLQCILANDAGSFATFSAGRIIANSEAVQAATGMVVIGNGGVFLAGSASYYGFTASANASIGATPDANISRNAAGILQVGTSAANASGSLYLAACGSSTANIIYNASTAATVIDYNVNASSTANNTVIRLINGTITTAASGVTNIISSTPSINQSGTAGYTWLNANITETATGSGAKNLVKLAVGGTTMFNVDNAGATTIGSGSAAITKVYSGSATLDFPSIAHNSYADLTITVTGAATGDRVIPAAPSTLEAGLGFSMWVTSANTVTVRVHNMSGGSVDPASATWGATVIKH